MYHEDPVINDIMLTIINDGDGSECGMTYKQRCDAAEHGLMLYIDACIKYDRKRKNVYGSPAARAIQIRGAAERIQAYYREHVRELT